MKSFIKKTISVEIILGKGDFSSGGNTVIINDPEKLGNNQGLPVTVNIEKPGQPDPNSATVDISGLSEDKLKQLVSLSFLPHTSQHNLISIKAGSVGYELSSVFQGEISSAWADFNGAPNIQLKIDALSGFYPQRIVAAPLSVNGTASAAELISQQAAQIGYSFINQDITAQVRNAIFNGSPIEKSRQIAKQVGAQLIIDDKTMLLKAADAARAGAIPLLSAESGLLGYPTFTQDGISVECIFRPDVQFGGLVKVESIVPGATGTWRVTKLSHNLSAYTLSGAWRTSLDGEYVG